MLIVISYDIPDDGRRTRLAKALEDFGERLGLRMPPGTGADRAAEPRAWSS
jgi:hypothetical protein